MNQSLLAFDADGVLIDYNTAYAKVWHKAFGRAPVLMDPLGYHARDRYQLATLSGSELEYFRSFFQAEFWLNVPAIEGAVDACKRLSQQGYDLVCVSAVPSEYEAQRLKNLQDLGFPIDKVFATPDLGQSESPKAETLRKLNPVAFVDDFIDYLVGVPSAVHKALVTRDPNNSPNDNPEHQHLVDSRHPDLAAFATWWLAR